jgi:hypothetical protein
MTRDDRDPDPRPMTDRERDLYVSGFVDGLLFLCAKPGSDLCRKRADVFRRNAGLEGEK